MIDRGDLSAELVSKLSEIDRIIQDAKNWKT